MTIPSNSTGGKETRLSANIAFSGGGKAGAAMRTVDWSRTPVGPVEGWPQSLKTAVRIMLECRLPMYIAWGREFTQFYNDAYRPILGNKHPLAMGISVKETWPEIWNTIGPKWEEVWQGKSFGFDNFKLTINRFGYPEDCYFNFSYSPVPDDVGNVAGVLVTFAETTEKVLTERRHVFELEMADCLRGLADPHEIMARATELLGRYLGVSRIGYGEIDSIKDMVSVARDWTNGTITSLAGEARPLQSFGPAIIAELRTGRTLRLDDIAADSRSAPYAAGYASIGTRSLLVVPLIKSAHLAAILYLHEAEPRPWSRQDVELAEEVAERTWAAVERARAEAALQESEARLTQLANTIPQLAWIADPDGSRHWYNDRWYEYTGTTPGQMEGWGWQSVHDPVLLPRIMEDWMACIAAGEPFQMISPLRGADGKLRPFFTSVAPLRNASGAVVQWFGTNTDISPIEQAERALRESEERLQEGLVAGRMAVWDWDLATGEISFSANVSEVFGQVLGQESTAWDSVHPEHLQPLRDAVDKAIRERSRYEAVIRMIRPDNGETIWIDIRGTVRCDAAGNPRSIRGISLDVTQRKRAEEELRAADRRKDEFLAMLSHELRNPLAPIKTAVEILALSNSTPEIQQRAFKIIDRQSSQLARLVDELLDVARISTGKINLRNDVVEVCSIVHDAEELTELMIRQKGQQLFVEPFPEPLYVRGDLQRLAQIMGNLVNNASKYTEPGGSIWFKVSKVRDSVEIVVKDNGTGIAPSALPHIFDLFTQSERTLDRSQGGLGIGLTFVKKLVEQHRGTVAAFSEGLGKGSEFRVSLPAVAEPAALSGQPRPALPILAKRRRILVVDDNRDVVAMIRELLQILGHEVTTALNGEDAIQAAVDTRPSVIFLDIGLPGLNGYDIAKVLRGLPEMNKTMLIALTGYGQPDDRRKTTEAGFDRHLVKPAGIAEISDIITSLADG